MNSFQLYQLHLKSSFFKNYCYVIVDTATNLTAVIDPAWELPAIEGLLANLNSNLVMILLTHSHFDHVNLVTPLLVKYKPQVVMSAEEIDYYHFSCQNLLSITDGTSLALGHTTVQCLLTPGHTAGSTCYLIGNSLFTGDTIFIEGCGTCKTDGGDPQAMYTSIQRIKNTIPPDVLIYPGHSYGKPPGYPLSYVNKQNLYFQIDNLEDFIAIRMRKNQKGILKFH